jgi:hypothetical protein
MREIAPMKVQLWVTNETGDGWKDAWIDTEMISGFFIPDVGVNKDGVDNHPTINVFVGGHVISVKQLDNITNWLLDNFVHNAKT